MGEFDPAENTEFIIHETYQDVYKYFERFGMTLTMGEAAFVRMVIRESIVHNRSLSKNNSRDTITDYAIEAIDRLFLEYYGIHKREYLKLFPDPETKREGTKELVQYVKEVLRPRMERI